MFIANRCIASDAYGRLEAMAVGANLIEGLTENIQDQIEELLATRPTIGYPLRGTVVNVSKPLIYLGSAISGYGSR